MWPLGIFLVTLCALTASAMAGPSEPAGPALEVEGHLRWLGKEPISPTPLVFRERRTRSILARSCETATHCGQFL
jgi:hypothetical protein